MPRTLPFLLSSAVRPFITTNTIMAFNDETLFNASLLVLYLICPLSALSLASPYGKHSRPGLGCTLISPALAWFLMEIPTLWLTPLLIPHGRHRSHPISIAVLGLFLLHYTHRTLIYPLRLHLLPQNTRTGFPLSIALPAIIFNLLNAYLQSRSASHYADYSSSSSSVFRVGAGAALFLWGMWVNISSDVALVRLKREAGGGYGIPRGGWFEVVACPNYMGEAAEWLGWALMAWSPAALAFFINTCCNLGPRARAHLAWYREKFGEDYPASRKAFIPFIY